MLARTVSLPAAGPCLRTRPAISGASSAAVAVASKLPRALQFSSMSMAIPFSEPILRLPARKVRRGPIACNFSTIVPAQATAVSEVQGLADEDIAVTLADTSPTLSPSSATSSSSSARNPLINPKLQPQSERPEKDIVDPTDELTDPLYTERAKLLLSKRSLIEGAARVDHERETASISSSPSTYTMPIDEISLMLNKSVSERPDDELDEKTKNSLKHQAGKAIKNKSLCGVVVSVGKMDRTVTVRFPRKDWSRKVKRVCKFGLFIIPPFSILHANLVLFFISLFTSTTPNPSIGWYMTQPMLSALATSSPSRSHHKALIITWVRMSSTLSTRLSCPLAYLLTNARL